MPRKSSTSKTELREKFLQYFVERRGDVEAARRDAGIGRAEFYRWLEEDAAFRERLDALRVRLVEEVEGEAFRRALSEKGSDALLATLLKGLRRDRYGEAPQGGPVQVVYISGLRSRPRPGVVVHGGEEVDSGGPQADGGEGHRGGSAPDGKANGVDQG